MYILFILVYNKKKKKTKRKQKSIMRRNDMNHIFTKCLLKLKLFIFFWNYLLFLIHVFFRFGSVIADFKLTFKTSVTIKEAMAPLEKKNG